MRQLSDPDLIHGAEDQFFQQPFLIQGLPQGFLVSGSMVTPMQFLALRITFSAINVNLEAPAGLFLASGSKVTQMQFLCLRVICAHVI